LTPVPKARGPDIKPEYSDKAAFLANLEATRPKQAVAPDGKNVLEGFRPGNIVSHEQEWFDQPLRL
jgi:hypothetical protein